MSVYKDIMEGINQSIEYERGNLKGVRKRIVKVLPAIHEGDAHNSVEVLSDYTDGEFDAGRTKDIRKLLDDKE